MSPVDIRTELQQLVLEKLRLTELNEGDLAEQLDSVQRLTLVVAIEDHFEVCFDPEDEERIRSFDDIVGVIHSKLSGS
jgi:acyl carrier protein